MGKALTPKKIELLQLISEFTLNQHYSPTIQELAALLKKSKTTVFEHCAALQKSGFLSTSRGKARSLKLTQQANDFLSQRESTASFDIAQENTGLPMLGNVAAGVPVEAFQRSEKLTLESEFPAKDIFALQVSGESMIEENIHPGDYVICKKASAAKNGDLVIAIVDDTETTLKRFFKEKTHIRLQPANSEYSPIITTNCQIQAQVIGLIRKY